MTDARLRGEWLTAAAHDGLSDQAYRVFHNALMHCNEQGTDGRIATRELRFLYPGLIAQEWLDELVEAGFWERTADGYQFIGWSTTLGQSTAADVEAVRDAARRRKRAQREREATARARTVPDEATTSPGTTRGRYGPQSHRESQRLSRRDVTAGVGQDRIGPPEGGHPAPSGGSGRAKRRGHDCDRDGHVMDSSGITCLRCEYRDRDRQALEATYGAG